MQAAALYVVTVQFRAGLIILGLLALAAIVLFVVSAFVSVRSNVDND